MTTAWKVLSRDVDTGDLLSCVMMGPAQVRYPEGVWVEAPVGGILVFETREKAREFTRGWGFSDVVFVIREVEVEDEVELPKHREPGGMTLDELRELWAGKIPERFVKQYVYDFRWPRGTQAYRRVRLIAEKRRGEAADGEED